MSAPDAFERAATVLDHLAAGRTPGRDEVLDAALAIDTLTYEHGHADGELLADARRLRDMAARQAFDLDAPARARAADLAAMMRRIT
jgi:hypothetical protein